MKRKYKKAIYVSPGSITQCISSIIEGLSTLNYSLLFGDDQKYNETSADGETKPDFIKAIGKRFLYMRLTDPAAVADALTGIMNSVKVIREAVLFSGKPEIIGNNEIREQILESQNDSSSQITSLPFNGMNPEFICEAISSAIIHLSTIRSSIIGAEEAALKIKEALLDEANALKMHQTDIVKSVSEDYIKLSKQFDIITGIKTDE